MIIYSTKVFLMSANPLSSKVCLSTELSTVERQIAVQALTLLPFDGFNLQGHGDKPNKNVVTIKKIVDGRGLACPMPLLKTKVALRDIMLGESLYVLATDPNSQADIMAFCRQSHSKANSLNNVANSTNDYSLALLTENTSTNVTTSTKKPAAIDTIFHFIITKTDSN